MTPVDHLLEQYWAGLATASEKEQLHRYAHKLTTESSFDDFESFLDSANALHEKKTITDEHAQQLLLNIKQQAGIPTAFREKKQNFRSIRLAVAACIIVALFICLPWFLYRGHDLKGESKQLSQVNKPSPPLSIYISNNGNTVLDTVLPDNSRVSLFPESSISFVDGFEPRARRISMQGKARFHVAKDKTRPFQVWAGGLITTAIGTIFEVSTLKQNQTAIKLIEGRVSVKRVAQRNTDSVLLQAGQSLLYLVQENQIRLSDHSDDINIGVATGKAELAFNNLPLAMIFKQLEMEFGIVVDYEVPSTDIRFSGRFSKQLGAEKIISQIVQQNKLTMEHTGGVFTIK